MAWSNPNGSWNNNDMDSGNQSAGQAKKLVVRSTTNEPYSPDHRAEVIETGSGRQALKIDGNTRIQQDGTVCGKIKPNTEDAQVPHLGINEEHNPEGTSGDPDVQIGWYDSETQSGNFVNILGKQVGVGTGPLDGYAVGIQGPAETVGDHLVSGTLKANNAVMTPQIEGLGDNLTLGAIGLDTGKLIISQSGHQTQVLGALTVGSPASQATEGLVVGCGANITGDVQLHGGNFLGGGVNLQQINDINVGGEIAGLGGPLQVSGNGDVSGDLAVHGALTADGSIAAGGQVSAGSLDVNGDGDVSGSLAVHGASSVVHGGDVTTLSVEQSSAHSSYAALSAVVNASNGFVRNDTMSGKTVIIYPFLA